MTKTKLHKALYTLTIGRFEHLYPKANIRKHEIDAAIAKRLEHFEYNWITKTIDDVIGEAYQDEFLVKETYSKIYELTHNNETLHEYAADLVLKLHDHYLEVMGERLDEMPRQQVDNDVIPF